MSQLILSPIAYKVVSHWTFQVHLKCTWSALRADQPVCFLLDWSWLVVRCCHRNFKTSKCRSAPSSKVKTFLEAALIQSKRRKLSVSHLERQISLSQASKRELIYDWGCWSPRNIGSRGFSQFCFMSYSLSQNGWDTLGSPCPLNVGVQDLVTEPR